jgi:predicted NBD/HSP70 family sugar kinase
VAVIAVDCGGTKLAYGSVAVPGAAPEEVYAVATPPSAASIPARIIEAIGPLIDPTITGVGIGIAGLVDADAGTLVWMPHVSGARIPVADPVGRALGIAATVDNDANLAALAEARAGAGAGYRMVLMITIGTGIGMGLAIEGEIERGRGSLGEAGHMTIDPEGPRAPVADGGAGKQWSRAGFWTGWHGEWQPRHPTAQWHELRGEPEPPALTSPPRPSRATKPPVGLWPRPGSGWAMVWLPSSPCSIPTSW